MRSIAKKTLAAAQATGNEVIVQVKANQATLLQDCQTLADTALPDAVYVEPWTKGHQRIEQRQVELFYYPLLTAAQEWDLVKVVIKVTRRRKTYHTLTHQWLQSDEVSFYIATLAGSAHLFCEAIRGHWHIENKNHYVRDVTLGEDASRIRINPHIFAKLRSFALNILRINQVTNVSTELFDNCMDLQRILNYVGIRQN
jgi:predicted transposase YbfD/YdcC